MKYLLSIVLVVLLATYPGAAVRYDSSNDRYALGTPPTFPNTLMGWFQINVDRDNYSSFFAFGTGGTWQVATNANGTTLTFYNGADNNGTDLSLDTWYHIAVVSAAGVGGARTVYLNGVSDIVTTGNESASELSVANSTIGEWLDGYFAGVKIYQAALSQSEIQREMRTYVPLRTRDVYACLPFFQLTNTSENTPSYFGPNRPVFTGLTTLATTGPPIAWGRWQ